MLQLKLEVQAKELLDNHFAENPRPGYIRLYVRPRKSSRGSSLALKPDVKGERDLILDDSGYRFIVSRHLAEQLGTWVRIMHNGKGGFEISSEEAFIEE